MSKQCWICHEESEAPLLTHLCRCHGNMGSAHPKCINRWALGTVGVKTRFGSDFDDTPPTLDNFQEGAFLDSDLETVDDGDNRLQSHPNCSVCGELYQIKCVQMVRENNIPLDGSNALNLLAFLVRRLLLPLCGRLLLVAIAVLLLFILLPWVYGLVFTFAHGSRACIHQRALKTVPFIRFPPLLIDPCTGSHYFRGDVVLSAYHANQLDRCNRTASLDEGTCPVAFPLLECDPMHAFPFVLFYRTVQFYWQWIPSDQLVVVRLLEAIAWAHDDVFYFDHHNQASHSWQNIMLVSVLKPWCIGLVAAISYRAMSRNFVSFIQFIRQYHTRNGRRNVPQYFPKLDLEESPLPPVPHKMTVFAIHDNPQLPNPPLLLRLMDKADAVLQHCDLGMVSQRSKLSALFTFVFQRVAVEVFIVTAWWFTLVSCPESWIPAIVVVSSVSLSIRALKPPILQPNRRYFDPFAYILQWGCEPHSTDVLVWYCAYVGEVIVFWLVLPVLGGFVVQQALAPYFANYYPIGELIQGDISVFYLPSLGMVLWYFIVGNMYLFVLIEVEGRVVMPLFAPGIHLYFMRAVNFNSSKINKKLLMGWKFVFCHIYDSDPLFMVWELFTTGVCELAALYCFLRTPCIMTGLLAHFLPSMIIDAVASPPDYSQIVCTTGIMCFFKTIVSWHNGLVVVLTIQLVCCITSVYPIQRVFLGVAFPLSENIGGIFGISHILFNEERRGIVRQWLGEETSEGLDGRLPHISLNQMPSMRDNEAYQVGGWVLRLQCLGVGALFLVAGCIFLWTPIVTSWVLLAPLLTSAGLESRAIAALSALLTPFFIYDQKMFVVAGAMSGAVVVSIPLCLLEIIWHVVGRLRFPPMPTSISHIRSQLVAPQRCALLRWTWAKYLLRCAVERGQQFTSTVVSKLK